MIIGILLIGIGSFISNPFSSIVISIGAAILGALIGTMITGLSGLNNISNIGIISEALSPGFNSDDTLVVRFREVYHFYHLTEKDNNKIWRYAKIDFTEYSTLGRLKGKFIEKRLDNKTNRQLEAIAGIWGERFIILLSAKDKEAKQVLIFPFMGKKYLDVYAGFCLFESWDQNHIITPCIISLSSIINVKHLGTVDQNYNEELYSIWDSNFKSKIKISL